ncbi:MAG: hypothetical protein AABY22_17910 [Nanoarchaeota archaeon]
MFLDEIDLKILIGFSKLDGKKITLWSLMKKIYPKGNQREYMRIRKKIVRMSRKGLFLITKLNKHYEYSLVKDNVKIKKIRFPDKISNSICLKICGKWEIFEI